MTRASSHRAVWAVRTVCTRLGAVLLAVLITAGSAALAQNDAKPTEATEDPLGTLLDDSLPSGMGDDFRAYQGYMALRGGRAVRARENAEAVLADDADSIAGHALLGAVLHDGEGDLARALHHVEQSLLLFDEAYPDGPDLSAPWFWHVTALRQRSRLKAEMGEDEARLHALDEIEKHYGSVSPGERAWPLLRIGRYAEARQWAELALQLDDEYGSHDIARTSLCAIEAELWDRQATWESCQEAARLQTSGREAVAATNAAEAALEVLRFDEAERYALEATRLSPDSPSSPWAFLIQVYLTQGRFSEAGAALPQMLSWHQAQPPRLRHQVRVFNELNAVNLLLATGHLEQASRMSQRALRAPDRHGLSNEDIRSRMAAFSLADLQVQRAAEERAWENLAAASRFGTWRAAAPAVWRIVQHRFLAWTSRRRAAAWLADERVLEASVRAYLADGVGIGEWQQLELVGAVGTGPVEAIIERSRPRDPEPAYRAYLDAMASEVARARGLSRDARDLALAALGALHQGEALLRARLLATVAMAEGELGNTREAVAAWNEAWQIDPGVVRRSRGALPVRVEAGAGDLAEAGASLVRRSPRFDPVGVGFRVRVDGVDGRLRACLLAPAGALLACGTAEPEEGGSDADLARRAIDDLHENAFAPRVELAQRDLQTLDGSPTAAGRAGDSAVRELDVLAPTEDAPTGDKGGKD